MNKKNRGIAWAAVLLFASVAGVRAADAPKLRYGFQPNRQYAYDVKIVADLEDEEETRQGVLSYTAVSAKEDQIVLRQSGMLMTSSKAKVSRNTFPGGPRFRGPMGPRFHGLGGPSFRGPGGPEGITLSPQGAVLTTRPLTPLPFLLGAQELLMIEDLAPDARSTWSKQREVMTQETEEGSFPMMHSPFFDSTTKTQRPAKERTDYTVAEVRPESVRVLKRYDLRTSEEGGKPARFVMAGTGEFVFDLKEGILASETIKYEIRISNANKTVAVPVSVTFKLLTAEEMAERAKKAEETRIAREKANAPKSMEPGEREKLLADLAAADENRIRAAADRLAKSVADDRPAEIAQALAPLLTHSNDWVKKSAAKALTIWVTPEVEDALIQASASEDHWVRTDSIRALAKIKSEKAAQAIAAQMYRSRNEVGQALKEMGPIAEAAAITCLNDRDGWARKETCQVLGQIGGEKALAALKEFLPRATHLEQRDAQSAIDALQSRVKAGRSVKPKATRSSRPAPGTAATEPAPAKDGYRTWRDRTGSYQIEAILLGIQDKKVALKRRDGKVVQVPLDKLSPEDQEFATTHAKDENPFE